MKNWNNQMKKVVVFGGGTGLSCLLSGLKLFPIDVTTIIAVSDNGSSTGVLKEELDIPAVGDVGKVLLSMANVDEDFLALLQYRFDKAGSLHNHPVRNIMLAALIDLKGDLTEATKYMCKLLNVSGTVLPLSGEKVDLVGHGNENEFFGEEEVSLNIKDIDRLAYDHDICVGEEVIEKIKTADLIVFSPGSLYTSIIPHLLSEDVLKALTETKAPLMYVANLVTQPGETDGYYVSDHIRILNEYLKNRKIDYCVANNAVIDEDVLLNYVTKENKKPVPLDNEKLEELGVSVIEGDIFSIESGKVRHDALKTAYMIFSFLMDRM